MCFTPSAASAVGTVDDDAAYHPSASSSDDAPTIAGERYPCALATAAASSVSSCATVAPLVSPPCAKNHAPILAANGNVRSQAPRGSAPFANATGSMAGV